MSRKKTKKPNHLNIFQLADRATHVYVDLPNGEDPLLCRKAVDTEDNALVLTTPNGMDAHEFTVEDFNNAVMFTPHEWRLQNGVTLRFMTLLPATL